MDTSVGLTVGFSSGVALTALILALVSGTILILAGATRLWSTRPWDTLLRPWVRTGLLLLGLLCLPLVMTACGGSGKGY